MNDVPYLHSSTCVKLVDLLWDHLDDDYEPLEARASNALTKRLGRYKNSILRNMMTKYFLIFKLMVEIRIEVMITGIRNPLTLLSFLIKGHLFLEFDIGTKLSVT